MTVAAKLVLPVAIVVLTGAAAAPLLRAQADLEVLPVQGQVSALVSAVGNAAVQVGPDGPLVVDTLPARGSMRWRAREARPGCDLATSSRWWAGSCPFRSDRCVR